MKFALMLRAYDKPGGIGIYSRNIVKHMLAGDSKNEYLLMYNNQAHIGTYADQPNVNEVFVPPCNQFQWDQWSVRREMKKWAPDLVFNTKFSVPLFTDVKRVMVLHGSSWFVHPELYKKLDILYVKTMIPVYCRASDFLVSNSDLTTGDFIKYVGVSPERIRTVRLAAGSNFMPVTDAAKLDRIRGKYRLPDRFILTVTSYDPRKNFGTLLKAFEACRRESDVQLVVIGKNCQKYIDDFGLRKSDSLKAIHFPGWVDQEDLPAIYSLASVYAFPSVYEEFGIPVVEAIACGCPVVSSNTGAIPELIGSVARLVDPFDAQALGRSLLAVIDSADLASQMREVGLRRASDFSWDNAARETIEILENVAR